MVLRRKGGVKRSIDTPIVPHWLYRGMRLGKDGGEKKRNMKERNMTKRKENNYFLFVVHLPYAAGGKKGRNS